MKIKQSYLLHPIFTAATVFGLLCTSFSHAENYSWGGATPGDWSNDANWTPAGGPPDAAGDGAFFNNGSALRQISLDGDFQVGDLRVGFSDAGGAQGVIRLNASGPSSSILVDDGNDNAQFAVGSQFVAGTAGLGTLTLGNTIGISTVGGGVYVAGINPALRDAGKNQGRLTGDLTLESGSSLSIGTAAAPSQFFVGVAVMDNSTSRGINATVVANTGSTVDIRSTDLLVGSNATRRYVTTPAEIGRFGTLDLRDANVGAFEVQNNFIVGRNSRDYLFALPTFVGPGSYGDVHLANVNGSVGGDLWVGDFYFDENDAIWSSSGQLTLDNATLSVAGDLDIWDTGVVEVTLNGAPSGVVLSASSMIDLVPDDGYSIIFNDLDGYAGIYYGLAWGGNKVASLETLVNDGKISWVNNADGFVDIFYDSNSDFSYIAVIPEPQTVLFLLVPLAWLLIRNRRR